MRKRDKQALDSSRRDFFRQSALAGGGMLLSGGESEAAAAFDLQAVARADNSTELLDLSPARWIWYPSGRCLANTMILFRREVTLSAKPVSARGWILGSSRYHLYANGRRRQFGPAPADPRFEEADPLDLTDALTAGRNVIGVQVLYYGHGDGTWPLGKPGLIFKLEIETEDGSRQEIVSDASWQAHLARAWRPGQYKRWYLRSFQEEFDARLHPMGWETIGFAPDRDWLPAMQLNCPANKPPIASNYPDYVLDVGAIAADTELRRRGIPLMKENFVPVKQLTESMWIDWQRSPEEYFEFLAPNAFRVERRAAATAAGENAWEARLDGSRAAALTFELAEQVVGWPSFTIEAPAGTVVELLVHEAHLPGGPPIINSHFNAWTRFVCREGVNRFETFDFESCRWIQLHIRNARGRVVVREIGMRRRQFPWPHEPLVKCSDPAIQKVVNAAINTVHNSAQETAVDGMARERQQYSGDGGHQLHALYYAFGETRLPARFVKTFSQGITEDGYFLDCWPAFDRLARLIERQLQLTKWGPLLDHGVGFNFDCYYYYLHTGDTAPVAEAYPRLLKFANYLQSIKGKDGLLPVENIGIPTVWMDHQAYQQQRHKQCSFNLYAAAAMRHALPAIARAVGDEANAAVAARFGEELEQAAVRHFWDDGRELFVVNKPWLTEEKETRLCDRSLATAVLFDQCPGGRVRNAVNALAEPPASMGISYPANATWRYWALAKGGRVEVVLDDFRRRWATMLSVNQNNTIQEDWRALPDSGAQWSHCAVVPLYFMHMGLAGIRPLDPGFRRCEIRPQLGDLESLELQAWTIQGPIGFTARGRKGNREVTISLPDGCEGVLLLPREERVALERSNAAAPASLAAYRLESGKSVTLLLTAV